MMTRAAYACPEWCVRPDHDADELRAGDIVVHYGPEFGSFIGIMGETTEGLAATLTDDNRDDLTSGELRQLAADALAAAAWLERVQA